VTDVNSGHQYILRVGQSVTGVDAKLQPGAWISGHITAAGDTHPLHGVCVDATTSGPASERPLSPTAGQPRAGQPGRHARRLPWRLATAARGSRAFDPAGQPAAVSVSTNLTIRPR
jgi:hypothetical protein